MLGAQVNTDKLKEKRLLGVKNRLKKIFGGVKPKESWSLYSVLGLKFRGISKVRLPDINKAYRIKKKAFADAEPFVLK